MEIGTQKQIIISKPEIMEFISSSIWDGDWQQVMQILEAKGISVDDVRGYGEEIIVDVS